jgi:methionyl-tRNA formyltransferase
MRKTAVVFAYHEIGVRCLEILKNFDLDIKLVVTHHDNPKENIWFGSVANFAQELKMPFMKITEDEIPKVTELVQKINPDFIFSFYFRFMLPNQVLASAKIAAFNMHGSLLPKYRGRVPINWAVLHGETETGATLHVMEQKPDAGDIVDQEKVAILPDETAFDVFKKVSDVAVLVLKRAIPSIVEGNFPRKKNDLAKGSYFGGRKPEDGQIHLEKPTQEIYNLIRALSPPYPSAYLENVDGNKFYIYRGKLIKNPQFMGNTKQILIKNGSYFLQNQASEAIEILSCGDDETGEVSPETFFKIKKIKLPWEQK